MGIEEDKQTVARFDRLTAACEADALDDICTPDMTNHALAASRSAGLEGTKQFLRECRQDPGKAAWMRAMMADQNVVTIAEADYVVQVGRRTGTWAGVTSAAPKFLPATTRTTSLSCTGSKTGVSPNGGQSATTSR
jgi:hypothetical protein